MSLIARAKLPTPLCRIPGDVSSKIRMLQEGEDIRLFDRKKVGLKTYYKTYEGYFVYGREIQIIRDDDYFFNNYKSKNLTRKNIAHSGAIGLTAVLDDDTETTSMWDARYTPSTALGSSSILTVGGGYGGSINVLGNSVGSIITSWGTAQDVLDGSSTTSSLHYLPVGDTSSSNVESLTVGDVVEAVSTGTTGELIASTATALLTNWVTNKLSYVIGFSTSSTLTNVLSAFGVNFKSLITSGLTTIVSTVGGIFGNILSNWTGTVLNNYGYSYKMYGTVNEALANYFKYKGCDGRMIVKTYAGLKWTQDESYATPTLSPKKNSTEVQIFKNIYNADYGSMTSTGMQMIREEFDLDIDRLTTITKFNRFRVVTPNNVLAGTKGYVFFTRPDLNLSMPDPTANDQTQSSVNKTNSTYDSTESIYDHYSSASGNNIVLDITRARVSSMASNLLKSHSTLSKYLMGKSAAATHSFIPVMGHLCTGIDVADEVLETTEFGETYTGWKYIYGTSMIKSKTAGSINVNFNDDNKLSIYKLVKMWTEYINAVYRGETKPHDIYIDRHILDYAISIYYFLTDNSGTNLLFWTKYTGCFPTSVPSSNFADNITSPIRNPQYSVMFAFSRKDDCNPLHLAEFNNLSSEAFTAIPMYNTETHRTGHSFVGAPFIDTTDGGYTYNLRFRA